MSDQGRPRAARAAKTHQCCTTSGAIVAFFTNPSKVLHFPTEKHFKNANNIFSVFVSMQNLFHCFCLGWVAPWHPPAPPACPGQTFSSSKVSSTLLSSWKMPPLPSSFQVSLATAGWVVESMAACNGILAVQQVLHHCHQNHHHHHDNVHGDQDGEDDAT